MDTQATFYKTWRVKNTGPCDWPTAIVIAFKSGENMGVPAKVVAGPLKSGEETNITVLMKAPSTVGKYQSVWQMQDPNGKFFGDEFTVQIASRPPLPAGYCEVGYLCKSSDGEYMVGANGFEYRTGSIGYRVVNAGFRWLIVQVAVKGETQTSYNPLYFKVRDSRGMEYASDLSATVSLTGYLQSGSLSPGEQVSGYIAFGVPANDNDLTLIYQPFLHQPVRVRLTNE